MTARSDRLITLFGGGGFVGRYVAQALFKAGARVRIAEREPRDAFYLRPLTGLGMIQFLRADIGRPGEAAAAVAGADAVINLVGILKGNFHGIHVVGARNVAEAAAAAGARVRIAGREPRRAFFLRPLTGLGMIQFLRVDIRDPAETAAAVAGADAVINLVGILKGNFQGVHVEGAHNVAAAAAAAGARALVHVSAIGADPDSPSYYGRTKGEGELAVREAFGGATIVRPSIVFGPEDNFVNRFARLAQLLPVIPVIRGSWKLQPVYAADLGKAIAQAALDPASHAGRTYELVGPQIVSMREVNQWLCQATGRGSKPVVEIPDTIGRLMARMLGWAPGAPITWDQWLMLQKDNVASGALPGFEAFGISPAPLAAVAGSWLTLYRRHGRFARPVEADRVGIGTTGASSS